MVYPSRNLPAEPATKFGHDDHRRYVVDVGGKLFGVGRIDRAPGNSPSQLAPIDDVEAAAAAIIAPVAAVIPGGIGLTWGEMKGLSRYNLVLIVEAYQRAVAA